MSWFEDSPTLRSDKGSMMQRWLRFAIPLLAALWLTGCGFHLRGSTNLAFSRLAVQGPNGPLLIELKRQIAATTATRITDDAKQAQAVFILLQDATSQVPMAYNADGTVAQYQLVETARFELLTPGGDVLISPTTITQTSSLSYSTSATLAKANEADLLYRGMRQDMVNRIMFQLAAVHPERSGPNAAASAP